MLTALKIKNNKQYGLDRDDGTYRISSKQYNFYAASLPNLEDKKCGGSQPDNDVYCVSQHGYLARVRRWERT